MPLFIDPAAEKEADIQASRQGGQVDVDKALYEPSFYDTFSSAVGQTVDEELSISFLLNREEEMERAAIVEKMKEEGYDLDEYIKPDGTLDYTRLKNNTQYPGLQDNATIARNRQERLDRRHEMATTDMERGSGVASMLGTMTAAGGLDPVNALAMGVSAPVSLIKNSVTVGQAALRVAGVEALVNAGTEGLIQLQVHNYKKELGRDYTWGDSFKAIAGAAAIGGAIGGTVGGISGYLRGVSKQGRAAGAPKADMDILDDAATALEANRKELKMTKEAFTEATVRLSAKSSDELLDELPSLTGIDKAVARGLLEGRAQVQRRAAKGFEPADTPTVYREPAEALEELGPGRVRGVAKEGDPTYLPKLRRTQGDLEAQRAPLQEELKAVRKKESKAKGARQKKEFTRQAEELEAKIAEIKQKEEGVRKQINKASRGEVDVEETARFAADEKARVAALNAADEAFIERAYQDGLIEADIAYLRKVQADYEDGLKARAPEKTANAQARAEGKLAADAGPDEAQVKLIMEEAPTAEIREIADEIEAWKRAEVCGA